jgi:hypothetical protein
VRHVITESDLDEWLRKPQWQMYASSAGKRLWVDQGGNGGPVFRVDKLDGGTIFLGADRAAAVEAYNTAC